jgi:hypothetical protein
LHTNFIKGNTNNNLYLRTNEKGIFIIEVFVDDIIFGGNDDLCKKFLEEMKSDFKILMIGEMKFFLGLHTTQIEQGIFIAQTKYLKEMLNKFGMEDCKLVGTPMVTRCKLSKNDESKSVY